MRGASGDTSSSSGDSDLPDLGIQTDIYDDLIPAPLPVASQPSPPASPEPGAALHDDQTINPLLLDRSPAGAIACRRELADRLHREAREEQEQRDAAASIRRASTIETTTISDVRLPTQSIAHTSPEDQPMVLELERERVLRREAEHLRREAEQLAQENAEKLSQAQSQLAELERDHHLDTDLPHQDSDEEGLDGETMFIQAAIDHEHARLQAHCAGPESGQRFQHTPEAITLAANKLMIVAEPPEC